MSSVCYCLVDASGRRTYVGKTTRLARRLRQHNGELVGGARATRGRRWTLAWHVTGFASDADALRFEWRLHHPPRRRTGVVGRIASLADVCALERWTASAPRAADTPLRVHAAPLYAARVAAALAHVSHVEC